MRGFSMRRWHRYSKFLSVILFGFAVLCGTAHASEAELQEAYVAYQEAANAGDLRAALPHAQRAYELGLDLYGPESRNTGLLAFNYGTALNEIGDWEDAAETLEMGLAALSQSGGATSQELFDTSLELAKAYMANNEAAAAQARLEEARTLTLDEFGPDSLQAAEISYYIGMLPLFGGLPPGSRNYLSIGRYVFEAPEPDDTARPATREVAQTDTSDVRETNPEDILSLAMSDVENALTVFSRNPDTAVERAKAGLVEAALTLRGEEPGDADDGFEQAINQLVELEYSDYFTTHLAGEWITSLNRHEWTYDVTALHVNQVMRLAHLRREGDIVPLVRQPPRFPVTMFPSTGSHIANRELAPIALRFTVDAEGRTKDIEITSTDHPRVAERPAIEAIENFIYAPRMENGVPVERLDRTARFQFTTERPD